MSFSGGDILAFGTRVIRESRNEAEKGGEDEKELRRHHELERLERPWGNLKRHAKLISKGNAMEV